MRFYLLLQYCAKVIRANFDEFRQLFSRTFDEISAIFRANFCTVLAIIQQKFGEISQGPSKIRKAKRNIEEANFFNSRKFEEISLKRNEISANFPAVKARSRGFRDFIYYIQKRLFTNRNLWLNKNVVNLLQGKNGSIYCRVKPVCFPLWKETELARKSKAVWLPLWQMERYLVWKASIAFIYFKMFREKKS